LAGQKVDGQAWQMSPLTCRPSAS